MQSQDETNYHQCFVVGEWRGKQECTLRFTDDVTDVQQSHSTADAIVLYTDKQNFESSGF